MSSSPELITNKEKPVDFTAQETFLQFLKDELSSSLQSKDILIHELIKQFQIHNIYNYDIFSQLEIEDLNEILGSLMSLNKDSKLRKKILIHLKILINKTLDGLKSTAVDVDTFNDTTIKDLFLQQDSKLDSLNITFQDFKKRLFDELQVVRTSPTEETNENIPKKTLRPANSASSISTVTPTTSENSSKYSVPSAPSLTTLNSSKPTQGGKGNGDEPFKQLKASKQDSSQKILMNAMLKHNIPLSRLDEYVLIISYQDKEMVMTDEDKPVEIFKNLKKKGFQPAIMLREVDKVLRGTSGQNELGDADDENNTPGGRL
ncbi:Ste50 protein [Hanseniaspora uvarum]|nr:Ste50 protein [Hanseniaspora uvarum]